MLTSRDQSLRPMELQMRRGRRCCNGPRKRDFHTSSSKYSSVLVFSLSWYSVLSFFTVSPRTQLFREFKLCKMLLRPLDDRFSASRSSGPMLRGYSRQTESYVSSLSNSVDNSANDADFDDDNMEETYGFSRSALFKYKRPGSNAYSLPIRVGLGKKLAIKLCQWCTVH